MSTKLFRYASRNVLLLVFIRFRVWIQDHFSTFLNFPFFACRVVKMWNSLPVDIVDFSSLSRFRRSLCKIDFSDFLTVQYFFFVFVLFVIRNLNLYLSLGQLSVSSLLSVLHIVILYFTVNL